MQENPSLWEIIMNKKKNRNILVWAFMGFIIFLAVPFLFQEEQISKKNNFAIDSEGGLPVLDNENPIERYLSRLKDFYGIKNKKSRSSEAKDVLARIAENNKNDVSSEKKIKGSLSKDNKDSLDFLIEAEGIEKARDSYMKDPNKFLGKDTVITKNGMALVPAQEGYIYDGKYYDYGTYPDLKYKKEIEKAISKYHRDIAKRLGLNAAYMRNPDGSLAIKYLDKVSLDNAQNGFLTASAKQHHNDGNIRILSRNGINGKNGLNSSPSLSKANLNNIDKLYGDVEDKLEYYTSFRNNNSSVNQDKQAAKSGIVKSFSEEILEASSNVPIEAIGRRSENSVDDGNIYDYAGAPVLVIENRSMGLNDLLQKYGIKQINKNKINTFTVDLGNNRSDLRNAEKIKKVSEQLIKEIDGTREDGKINVVSVSRIPRALENLSSEIKDAYKAFPRSPYVDVSKKTGQPDNIYFTEVFLRRSGMEDLFNAMGVSQADMTDLEARYSNLDERRMKNNEYFNLLANNESLQKRMPKIVFYLGKVPSEVKDNRNEIAVASPSSFLYAYAPTMAPDFVINGCEGECRERNLLMERMSPERFLRNVNAKGSNNIVIVNDPAVAGVLKRNGVKTVRVIDSDTLYSGTPESIGNVLDNLSTIISDKVKSDEILKEEFIKHMQQINKEENQK